MGKWLNGALKVRRAMDEAGNTLTDEQAADMAALFMPWKAGVEYKVNQRVRYGDLLYKCLQAHTSQETWQPDVTPALWVEVAAPGEYRQIKENMLPTEAFELGEIGWWQTKDNLYRSLIAANVYTPVTYPAGWEKQA